MLERHTKGRNKMLPERGANTISPVQRTSVRAFFFQKEKKRNRGVSCVPQQADSIVKGEGERGKEKIAPQSSSRILEPLTGFVP